MPEHDTTQHQQDAPPSHPPVPCQDCAAALESHGREMFSFLLLDELTIPLLGCDAHVEQFADTCGYTTEETATVLGHRPAGGVVCPSCRGAVHTPHHPLVPIDDGAVVVLACQRHQSDIIDRFHTGLDMHQRLTTSL